MPSATRAGRSWDRMLLSPLSICVLSMPTLAGLPGILPGLVSALRAIPPLLPGPAQMFLGLHTFVCLLEAGPTRAPHPP